MLRAARSRRGRCWRVAACPLSSRRARATPNMVSDKGRERQARFERVVAPDELEVDRQRDQHPAQGDLLEKDLGNPKAVGLRWKSAGSSSAALPSRLRRRSQYTRAAIAATPIASSAPTASPPSCQTSTPTTSPPIPITERNAPTPSIGAITCVWHVADLPAPDEDGRDDQRLEREPDAPREERRHEAADQRADRRRDRARRPDQREDLRPRLSFEVPVDQGLHRRQVERGAESADDGPEHDDRRQALCEHHRERAKHVEHQTDHIGPLAAEEVAKLAADQDEGGRHQCLDRDCRLDTTDGRIEVLRRRLRSTRS